jgi:hypothetical protein
MPRAFASIRGFIVAVNGIRRDGCSVWLEDRRVKRAYLPAHPYAEVDD